MAGTPVLWRPESSQARGQFLTFRTQRKPNVRHLTEPVVTRAGDAGTQGERSELWGSRGTGTSSRVVSTTQVDGL